MAEEQARPDGVQDADPDDGAALFRIPSTFVNRIYISPMGPVIRVTFAEQQNEAAPVNFRCAVTMSIGDFLNMKKFAEVIESQVVEIDPAKMKKDG